VESGSIPEAEGFGSMKSLWLFIAKSQSDFDGAAAYLLQKLLKASVKQTKKQAELCH
jgi:hypothetical protein